ncbi:MAG TPA: hypothetical protein VK589_06970 [Chryseolinea sp.]|nr:hypothetical protein [Chryseolinea sp.]
MNPSYTITQAGFIATTIIFYGLLLQRLRKSLAATSFTEGKKKKIFNGTLISLIVWAIATSVLSLSGILSDFNSFPPKIGIVLIIPLVAIIWMVRTKEVKEILMHTPPESIIWLQSFRIVVEVLIWRLFVDNLAPIQMTFEGRNFDILSGITALAVAYLVANKKISSLLVIIWNFACIAVLLNIVTIAVLSMPTPFRVFMNEPANTIVTKFPVVWLPALLVPLAYGLHFLSLRQYFNQVPR